MLIRQYRQEFVRPPNPNARHLRCFAHLEADIGAILPHLNAVLGGFQYFSQPPSLTLKYRAKLITLYPRMIAINMVQDQNEAREILEWLRQIINDTWNRRREITPRFEGAPQPRILDILKLLPKDNCGQCGLPTCLVFAAQVSEALKVPADCPPILEQNRKRLTEYLMNLNLLKQQGRP
jgi:ArsR family metal-binding transcriptional regulator